MNLKRPFHETIVDVIRRCPPDKLGTLLELLAITEISTNKEAIISALQSKKGSLNKNDDAIDYVIKCIID